MPSSCNACGRCSICDLWSGGGSGAAAQQQASLLAQQANTRANAIKSDTASIDSAFQPFNDDYYSNFTKAYEANQEPQLDFGYGRAGDQLQANLASSDQDEGSTGARQTADLAQTYGTAQGNIANSAADATNQLRSTVDNAKTGLYGLAQSATDPLTMGEQAQASAGALVAPQSYPTLGNVFSDVLSPAASGVKTYAGAMNQYAPNNGSPPISGQGSASGNF
jgi:hypothetical protein